MGLIFALLTIAANLFVIAIFVIWLVSRRREDGGLLAGLRDAIGPDALWYAWVVALVTTLGSLYYSEIAHFDPCQLCWYQRIAIYPMSVILLVAAIRRDAVVKWYVIPVLAVAALDAVGGEQATYDVVDRGGLCERDEAARGAIETVEG